MRDFYESWCATKLFLGCPALLAIVVATFESLESGKVLPWKPEEFFIGAGIALVAHLIRFLIHAFIDWYTGPGF